MGLAVGAAVGLDVGLAVAAGFGVAVAAGLAVGLAVGAAVGFAVGFAVAAGFGVEVAEGFAVADGFAVVLGLLTVLLSVFDAADELLSFGLSVLLLSVFASGVAVGSALALLELAVGLLLTADVLLSSPFSDTVLLTVLDAELSVTVLSVLLPAHAASDNVSAAAIHIAVIFFLMIFHSSLVSL